MKMKWEKLGKIYETNKNSNWMYSHAAVPFAVQLKGNIYRIFFTTRDKNQKSYRFVFFKRYHQHFERAYHKSRASRTF